MSSGVYWNQPVCPSVYPSVYKILVSVKGLSGGIKSHLWTFLVLPIALRFTWFLRPSSDQYHPTFSHIKGET